MSWNQQEMQEVYAKVQKLATTDEAFRKQLLEDAKAAIEKVSGKELPEGFTVKFIERDPAYSATFLLPDFIGEEVEIDDDDLENVAGGVTHPLLNFCGIDCLANTRPPGK